MTEVLAQYIESAAQLAPVWGFALIFFFMAVESSFIPFPSEIVMIPAGFLAYRGELTTGIPWVDAVLALISGTAGSLLGAYVNYWLGIHLGRPFLHKYGKYFFLKEQTLDRAEEVFRNYGEITTFVCRLIPSIRQLISIPAGLSKMPLDKFFIFTGLGAGIWTLILLLVGWYFAHLAGDMSYADMIVKGKNLIAENYGWIFLALAVLVAAYAVVHRWIMKPSSFPAAED